jgi:probable HAF family extracellular repeat protein
MTLPNHVLREALVAALALTVTLSGTAAVEYTPVVLESPGLAVASGVNTHRQVVGRANVPSGEMHAVLWDGAEMVDLGTIPGGNYSEAFDVNDRGQVVGWSMLDQTNCIAFDGCWHAFLWENGTITDLLGLEPDFQSYAYSINNSGQIVGISATQNYPIIDYRPVLWHNGSLVDLGKPEGATDGLANGVNASGAAAGYAHLPDGRNVPMVWSHGTMTTLPGAPGTLVTQALKINNRGQVVGNGNNHALLWTDGILAILPNPAGAHSSTASDINTSGLVVGKSSGSSGRIAVVWEDGQPRTLPKLAGWAESEAFAVNDRGDVVGMAMTPRGLRAVMWVRN